MALTSEEFVTHKNTTINDIFVNGFYFTSITPSATTESYTKDLANRLGVSLSLVTITPRKIMED